MKKMISFIAVAIIATVIFTGCERNNPQPGPVNPSNGSGQTYSLNEDEGLVWSHPPTSRTLDTNGDGVIDAYSVAVHTNFGLMQMYCKDELIMLAIDQKLHYPPVWITWAYDSNGLPNITSVY